MNAEIERRIRDAFPERADAYLGVIDRWAWWSGRTGSESCEQCGRDPLCVHAFEEFHYDDEALSYVRVCGACIALMREILDAPTDDFLLSELQRALSPEEFAIVSRDAASAAPATPIRGGVLCCVCWTDDLPRLRSPRRDLCIGCIADGAAELRKIPAEARTDLEKRILARL